VSTREAREVIEAAVGRFDLSRTLTKKIAAAVLDEFRVQRGASPDGTSEYLVLVREAGKSDAP
jgi:hypothetical protein